MNEAKYQEIRAHLLNAIERAIADERLEESDGIPSYPCMRCGRPFLDQGFKLAMTRATPSDPFIHFHICIYCKNHMLELFRTWHNAEAGGVKK